MNGPLLDGENERRQAELESTAFNLEDVHGFVALWRTVAWIAVFVLLVVIVCGGIILTWRAGR